MKRTTTPDPDFRSLFPSAQDQIRLYQDIVNMVPIGLYVLHLEDPADTKTFRVMACNPAMKKVAGISPEAVIGKYFIDISPETFETGRTDVFREIILSGKPRELGVTHHPGNKMLSANYYYVSAFPLPGNAIGVALENITRRQRAEDEIRQTNAFLNSILENIPHMIFVKDAKELRFLRFNRAGEELLGYSREQMIGKNDYDFFPKQEADFFTGKDQQVLREGKLLDIPEEKIQARHKGLRLLHTKKIPVTDENGHPIYLLGISEDITDRKKEEEQLYEYKKFFDLSFDLICIANTSGYFKILSPSFSKALGYTRQELLERQFIDFIHPDDVPATLAEIEKLKTGAVTIDFLNRYRCKDGSYRYFQWVSTPDPVTGEIFAIARDVTEQKRAEEKIYRLNEELQRAKDDLELKVLERTAELQEANEGLRHILDKLERSNQRLEEFAYMSSHNLRAPLANLTSLVSMYGQQKDGDIIFEKIRFTANQLNTIVNDLTELVALDRPVVDKKEIRFEKLLQAVKASIEHQIQSAGATITADFSQCESITYPYSHAQSIFQNLLTNAIKYRAPDRASEIKITTTKKSGFVKLVFKDNGIGIDEKNFDKIFKAFKRLHQEMDGKGLGLYIVRRQLEMMGGAIEVKSSVGKGSEFTVLMKDDPPV